MRRKAAWPHNARHYIQCHLITLSCTPLYTVTLYKHPYQSKLSKVPTRNKRRVHRSFFFYCFPFSEVYLSFQSQALPCGRPSEGNLSPKLRVWARVRSCRHALDWKNYHSWDFPVSLEISPGLPQAQWVQQTKRFGEKMSAPSTGTKATLEPSFGNLCKSSNHCLRAYQDVRTSIKLNYKQWVSQEVSEIQSLLWLLNKCQTS